MPRVKKITSLGAGLRVSGGKLRNVVEGASGLATVATTGDYNDLLNRPTLVDTFTDLGDVPGAYTGHASKTVKVKADESGLEFVSVSGGGGIDSGTAFPGFPATNDVFYRTDRSLLYFYNGTHWLTLSQYIIPLSAYVALPQARNVNTTGLLGGIPALQIQYDFWMETFEWVTFIQTTNSATIFWNVLLEKVALNTTRTTIVAPTTAADAPNTQVHHSTSVGALLGQAHEALEVSVTKTNLPGNLYLPGAAVVGRLVG